MRSDSGGAAAHLEGQEQEFVLLTADGAVGAGPYETITHMGHQAWDLKVLLVEAAAALESPAGNQGRKGQDAACDRGKVHDGGSTVLLRTTNGGIFEDGRSMRISLRKRIENTKDIVGGWKTAGKLYMCVYIYTHTS